MTLEQARVVSARTGLEYDKARFLTDGLRAIEPLTVFRAARSPSGFSALVVRERYEEADVEGVNAHILARVLDERSSLRGHIAGTWIDRPFGRVGDTMLIPARAPSQWFGASTSRILQVHLDPGAIANWSEDGRERELRIAPSVNDKMLDRLLEQILLGLQSADRLFLEGLALQVASRLLSHHIADRPPAAPRKGGLAPWQARRVQEFLAENLALDIGIEELAAIARLSPFHFARAFKATVGMPPHAYQRHLRIARARQLLVDPTLSIMDVALSVGFDSPQAFARAFLREMGVTPSDYRRNAMD